MPRVFSVRVRNMSSLQAKAKRMDTNIQNAVLTFLKAMAQVLKSSAKNRVISGPKTGRIYRRWNPFRLHQASAPGQAPASDTGLLVASIDAEVDPQQFNIVLSAAAPYARDLEYGTSKMAPRPFLLPTIYEYRDRIVEGIRRAIKGVL